VQNEFKKKGAIIIVCPKCSIAFMLQNPTCPNKSCGFSNDYAQFYKDQLPDKKVIEEVQEKLNGINKEILLQFSL
jgi:hypothetical protein